jgi:hypothetical protein
VKRTEEKDRGPEQNRNGPVETRPKETYFGGTRRGQESAEHLRENQDQPTAGGRLKQKGRTLDVRWPPEAVTEEQINRRAVNREERADPTTGRARKKLDRTNSSLKTASTVITKRQSLAVAEENIRSTRTSHKW